MNLQANLLLESERRSARVLNVKALVRIAAITLPAVVLIVIGTSVVRYMLLKKEYAMLEEQWADVEPKQKQALAKQLEINANKDMRTELDSLAETRLPWHEILGQVQRVVPPTIQFEMLIGEVQVPLIDKTPARVFRFFVRGKAKGRSAEQDVPEFAQRLRELPLLTEVKVTSFGQDPSGDEWDRVFQIDCESEPRKMK